MCTFCLNNKQVYEEINITFNGVKIKYNFKTEYLGVILYHLLTFKEHMVKISMEIKSLLILKTASVMLMFSTRTRCDENN